MIMENSDNPLSAITPSLGSGNGAAPGTTSSTADHARKSGPTGPRTKQGKERSKRNALKHGIFSQAILSKDESPAELESLRKKLRKDLRPAGELEDILVEKLVVTLWRLRRLYIAETAEIRRSVEFLAWDEEDRQAERANNISAHSIQHEGGLIRHIANPKVLERCLELLKELRDGTEADGFDEHEDSDILGKVYGDPITEKWQRTLLDSYRTWLWTAQCADAGREEGHPTPEECEKRFLQELDEEIKRLERYKEARASIESERMKLEALQRRVLLASELDRFLRSEASLERNFDRTLSQLERFQRMRRGQPVLPKLEVRHSIS
jgi:hypothetical protein